MQEILLGRPTKFKLPPLNKRTWHTTPQVGNRVGMQSTNVTYNGKFYLFGGRLGESVTGRDTTWLYDGETFAPKRTMPKPIIMGASCVVGDKIYILGGCYSIANGQENQNIYVYDPATDTYVTEGTMPFKALGAALVNMDGYLYMYGGMVSQSETGYPTQFYRYKLADKSWEKLDWHRSSACHSAAGWEKDGLLYFFGGEQTPNARDGVVRTYDPVTQVWDTKARFTPAPSARSAFGKRYDDDTMIFLGGRPENSGNGLKDCWIYKISTNEWAMLADFPWPNAFGCLCVDGDNIISVDSFAGNNGTFHGVWKLR